MFPSNNFLVFETKYLYVFISITYRVLSREGALSSYCVDHTFDIAAQRGNFIWISKLLAVFQGPNYSRSKLSFQTFISNFWAAAGKLFFGVLQWLCVIWWNKMRVNKFCNAVVSEKNLKEKNSLLNAFMLN